MGFRSDFDEARSLARSFGNANDVRRDRERRKDADADRAIRVKKTIEGDFAQKAAQAREMEGTFQQNADQERAIQGTYGQRYLDTARENDRNRKADFDQSMLAYGPESTGAKTLEFEKEKWPTLSGFEERRVSADEARAMQGNRSVQMIPQYGQNSLGETVKIGESPMIIDTKSGEQITPKGNSAKDWLTATPNNGSAPASAAPDSAAPAQQKQSLFDSVASGESNQKGLDRFLTPSANQSVVQTKPQGQASPVLGTVDLSSKFTPPASRQAPANRNLTVQEAIGMTGNAIGQGVNNLIQSGRPSMERAQVNANTAYQMAGNPQANLDLAKDAWKKIKRVPYRIGEMPVPGTTYYGQ